MFHKQIKYRTIIKEIEEVTLVGNLEFRSGHSDFGDGGWCVGGDQLEEWFEKFDGKRVVLTIRQPGPGDDKLIAGAELEQVEE